MESLFSQIRILQMEFVYIMLSDYIKKIAENITQGDSREESFYSSLEQLLDEYARSFGKKKIHITTLPKSTEAGNPDFRVWDGKQKIVGYIEAKNPAIDNLDTIENSEQLVRYRHTFPNLVLTNFFEFRLYRNGDFIRKTFIARPFVANTLKTTPPVENKPEFTKLLESFFSFSLPKVYSAKSLATELAKRTSFLRDEVVQQELATGKSGANVIHGFYEAFQKYLIAGLSEKGFADLYSQTISYGLFAARIRAQNGFNRKLAYVNIPRTIGILRDVFRFISIEDPPKQMEWIIDDIAEVLSVADVNGILQQYFRKGKGKDPVIHFYETFLSVYDPKTRERRGVYYTPEPVVGYIVRSIHHLLQERFGKADGLADESVTVLDPASGTLTFLSEAAKLAVETFIKKFGDGDKRGFIRQHILDHFFAFELMMAPYAVGHLKMSFLLEELGYRLKDDDRCKLYLTNSLEMEHIEQTNLPGMASLSEESSRAGEVKKKAPILVILGNPPYSGHSANKGKWIDDLLKKGYSHSNGARDGGYYQVDGKPLGERNPKWLQDDYVKFIRFAQWKIDQSGSGILGFITNHSYLDNPTFRGMRRSLMNSFDEIHIVDLHGNSLKKERCPDGSVDKNVFDIRQGVAIGLFIKTGKSAQRCKVFHTDIWGVRDQKYEWLERNDLKTTNWQELSPKPELYLFVPRDEQLLAQYETFLKVTDIFPVSSVGVVTSRDKFVIDTDKKALKRRIRMFQDESLPNELVSMPYKLKDKKNWKIENAREAIGNDKHWEESFSKILYRPFDARWIFYHEAVIERSRRNVMRHMLEDNLGLIFPKRVETKIPWTHVLCSNMLVEHVTVSLKTIDYVCPLFCYPDPEEQRLLKERELVQGKQPNIGKKVLAKLSKTYVTNPSPEAIFYYIYAVLYSETYRQKYAEFLKTDFPRVPFTKNRDLFQKMAAFGEHLADLHLMKSPDLDTPMAKFQGSGDNRIAKIRYDKKNHRIYINKNQYFENVNETVRQYRIGGYQVCQKWLKDRKGRVLSLNDMKHYVKIITAIAQTMEIQKKIDGLYEKIEAALIPF